jgi:hypothetical protein
LEGIRKVDHLGDWGLFEGVVPKRACKTCHFTVKRPACIWRATSDNLCFPLGCWVLDSNVVTATSNWIAEVAFLVTGEHDERNGLGFDRPEFRYRKLPIGENFKQKRFEPLIPIILTSGES